MGWRLRPALLLVLLGTAAQAQPVNSNCPADLSWPSDRAMQLSVRDGEGGRQFLVAEGVIDAGLPARLEAALKANPRIGAVLLRSPGGDARAGNAAGDVLRQSRVETRIPAGWACGGSCAFMFMGGIIRSVEPGGVVVATMFTHTGDPEVISRASTGGAQAREDLLTEIARSSARAATEDTDYLLRMGVRRALLSDIFYRQSAVGRDGSGPSGRCLTQEELRRYNVVNF